MAERQIWFSELKVSGDSPLKSIVKAGCGVTFTKDFGDRTRHVFDLEKLTAILNPLGPFATRGRNFPTFYEALDHASEGQDGSTIAIRTEDDRVLAYVDLT